MFVKFAKQMILPFYNNMLFMTINNNDMKRKIEIIIMSIVNLIFGQHKKD